MTASRILTPRTPLLIHLCYPEKFAQSSQILSYSHSYSYSTLSLDCGQRPPSVYSWFLGCARGFRKTDLIHPLCALVCPGMSEKLTAASKSVPAHSDSSK